jgi:hypothetical protein
MKTIPTHQGGRLPAELKLGIRGFSYSDLYEPQRLAELLDVFDQELAGANPELFASWDDYRRNPAKPRTPVEISALLVGVASHVSRFLTRLFRVEAEVDALAAATADQDPVFRFKVDFVRRRVLPALKKIQPRNRKLPRFIGRRTLAPIQIKS